MTKWFCVYTLISFLLISLPVKAADDSRADINMHGVLVAPPPCEVNNDQKIDVDFGDLSVKKIDGVNYRRTLSYKITCGTSSTSWNMFLVMSGTPAGFDTENATLSSSVDGLGVKVWLGGQPFTLNTQIAINPLSPPSLEAAPVKELSTVLSESAFQSTGTLIAVYQ